MIFFKYFSNSPFFLPNFTNLMGSSVRFFLFFAIFALGLAVLVLLFPLILAFFVAGFCFLIALFSLRYAWKIYRLNRSSQDQQPRYHVEIHDIDNHTL